MRTQRIRDPIHDMIVFRDDDDVDRFAWQILQTADLQRLRRIKQLGVSEYVFPSATHTRFSHSVGVFHNARRLIKIIKREIDANRTEGKFDDHRARTALFAALLHDIGHGPFSHAFEEAIKSISIDRHSDAHSKSKILKHEDYTADMISDPVGDISHILKIAEIDPKEVAKLIKSETPEDIYHAIVSSSFDADRLDYLARDRYMTGTGAGAIDTEWLMDNARVATIDISPPDDNETDPIYGLSFCLNHKARDAAEDFLLARYRLYTNVYFHKTTRGIEKLLSAFFRSIASSISEKGNVDGLNDEHPFNLFFSPGGDNLNNYRLLDDTVVWGALHSLSTNGSGNTKDLATRVLYRKRPYCLDLQNVFPDNSEAQRSLKHSLDGKFKSELGNAVFRDTAKLSLYGEIGADDGRAQKRLMIQMANNRLKEITKFEDAAIARSDRPRSFERYYFLNESDFKIAQDAADSVRERSA